MSRVFDLCGGSDDNGEWPNPESVPTLPLSRKRRRDKEESFNDAHPCNENGPGNKTATGSAKFVFDLELTDGEVSSHRKLRSERSAKNAAAGKSAQTPKGVHATKKDVGSEDAQVVNHLESHEGIAAAASHLMTLLSEQTSRDDGSANKHSNKQSTWEPPSNATGRQGERLSAVAVAEGTQEVINEEDFTANTSLGRESPISIDDSDDSSEEALPYQQGDWTNNFKELCQYRQHKRRCLFRCQDPEYAELSKWVFSQRFEYNKYKRTAEGEHSILTPERVKALEGIGFLWHLSSPSWEERLSELADYRKNHGHCNVPWRYSENAKLGTWVTHQRSQYRLRLEGKTSSMTTFQIQELESLGFTWVFNVTAWEDLLSDLSDYRKLHGHCNVPTSYSENTKLGRWVASQRFLYRLRQKGKKSPMTLLRIQALESIGFEWETQFKTIKSITTFKHRLSELADYHKIHGHCNVPKSYIENSKLVNWVSYQRRQYKLHLKGKASSMTLSRIQELESMGLEWAIHVTVWKTV